MKKVLSAYYFQHSFPCFHLMPNIIKLKTPQTFDCGDCLKAERHREWLNRVGEWVVQMSVAYGSCVLLVKDKQASKHELKCHTDDVNQCLHN